MQFQIPTENLKEALSQISTVVGNKPGMPILSNVLIEGKDSGKLILTATDLGEAGLRCCVQADVKKTGDITIPANKLKEIVAKLPGQSLVIKTEGDKAFLQSQRSHFQLLGLPKKDFPEIFPNFKDPQNCTLDQSQFLDLLKSVSYAQSKDENRYILNGVYFELKDKTFKVVATDGRRLALKSLALDQDATGSFILPAKTVSRLENLLRHKGQVCFDFDARQAVFKIEVEKEEKQKLTGSIYLVSRLVEGQYPDYQKVIPKETENRARVDRLLLAECIDRVATVTTDKDPFVCVEIQDNEMKLSGRSTELGQSEESLSIEYKGPNLCSHFNPKFLLDPLKSLTKDAVFFEFKDSLSPAVFKTLDNFLCIIMPVRDQ